MNKALQQVAASEIARNALVGVSDAPGLRTARRDDLQRVADKITTQDARPVSKRIWAAVTGAVTLLLLAVDDPATAAAIAQHLTALGVSADTVASVLGKLTAISGLATVILPLWSKATDARAVRGKPQEF